MDEIIEWLMEGDPAIRWQTMRDILDRPAEEWQAERRRTIDFGWGARFLQSLRPDGSWAPGRWTDTVWTLLTVMDCGLPPNHPPLRDAAHRFLDSQLPDGRANDERWLLTRVDQCHLGFWLRVGAYFLGDDPRLAALADTLLRAQMPDGGWNCRKRTEPHVKHSSFHTTFNVLEGLRPAAEVGLTPLRVFHESESRAIAFMLAHHMYRSDRTGEIISDRFTKLTFPSHWHYTVLRGMDYVRTNPAISDSRLNDPINLLVSRRRPNGRWPAEGRIPGAVLFDMEKIGGDSRWNTLRAMRVISGYDKGINV